MFALCRLLVLCGVLFGSSVLAHARPAVEITVEHQPVDAWHVTYRFAEPVREARFRRAGYGLRARYWRVVRPAHVQIDHGPEGDVGFSSSDGKSFAEVELDIPSYAHESNDYTLFDTFTDGSVLVYSGHFDVKPMVCRRPRCDRGELEEAAPNETNQFVLVPRANEKVVLRGVATAGPARWSSDGEGAWAYFGGIVPSPSAQLVTLLDPGLPAWLTAKLQQLLPAIFLFYADRTGQALHPEPVVYLNFNPLPSDGGIGIGGGTRTGSIQLLVDLGKRYVHEESPRHVERIAFLLAHEGAHLWNNQMFPQDDDQNDWLHEGGADAFAFRAMRHFAVVTQAGYEEELSEALSTCLLALDGKPVDAMIHHGRYEAYYPCGSTIGLWTEAAVRQTHPTFDLFDFWAQLFLHAPHHHYDAALYYQTLDTLAGIQTTRAIRSLVEERHSDAPAFVTRELAKVGITIVEETPSPLPHRYEELAGRWAFESLVADDCRGTGARGAARVTANDGALELLDATGCAHLRAGIPINTLGGFDVKLQGARAFDYLVNQCSHHQPVELQSKTSGMVLKLPCRSALRPRPAYLRVSTLPPVR